MAKALSSAMVRAVAGLELPMLAALFRRALGGRRVALCFHRVASRRRQGELLPKLTMAPEEIDALIEFLLWAARRDDRWLTISFDDGYRDSADYILQRAPRWPQVAWLFFVCPQKTELGSGFRWDLAEMRRREEPSLDEDSIIFAPVDVARENLRDELRRLAACSDFSLADVDTCARIQRLPNASLGNHTNVHHRAVLLAPEQFRADLDGSLRDFARLFGPAQHFAFPFGLPGLDFSDTHVAALRERGRIEIWSTEPRPYRPEESDASMVLPRFAIDGTRSWRESVAHIALRSVASTLRRVGAPGVSR